MSTFYLDLEGGNDASDGTTFANRWKSFVNGATAARIAPGDTIRVMGSTDPTSLSVNGTWTDGPLQATVSITSSTNATPIVVTKASHGLTTGDTVVVTGHTTNTNANGTWEVNVLTSSTFELAGSVGNGVGGASGTFRQVNCCRVKLASAVTKTIQDCGFQSGAWTASANVTASADTTDFKEGYGSCKLVIAAGFTTGLAAYKALGASTDFSAYRQISFWIKQTLGTVGAKGACTISLCSDTAGVTAVNTVDIPNIGLLNSWMCVTVDTAGTLGASIQSVAFNVVTDNAAQTFFIDNIVACKNSTSADALSLTSLIGKNSGNETFIGIQSISDTRIMLDNGTNTLPTDATYRGYAGTTETVTAYKRETIKVPVATLTTAQACLVMDSGSLAGGLIYFEGGWDRTAMTTQNLETWIDGQNGAGEAFCASTKSYISLNKLNAVRFTKGYALVSVTQSYLDNLSANNCQSTTLGSIHVSGCYGLTIGTIKSVSYNSLTNVCGALFITGSSAYVTAAHIYRADGNGGTGRAINLNAGTCDGIVLSDVTARNNVTTNVVFSNATNCTIFGLTSSNSSGTGMSFANSSNCRVYDLTSTGNTNGVTANGGTNYLVRASVAEATEVSLTTGINSIVYSQTHDVTANNHQIFNDGCLISSDTTTRHTASGLAWKMSPTSATRTSQYPCVLPIAKFAVNASTLVTVTAWMRRDSTSLTMRLVCKGGQIGGVASDVATAMTAAINTWEQVTITFTPNEAGIVEITAEAYGGSTLNGWVDDMGITQA